MTRNRKIAIAAAAAVTIILIIIGISSCASSSQPKAQAMQAGSFGSGTSTYGSGACVPPLACGPSYAGYVPPYYAAHPSFVLLSPYSSLYAPSFNGRSYTAVQTPVGRAPVPSRAPMPYPPGYKPVPGDFVPPTAPKPVVKAPVPAVKAPAVKVPAVKVPSIPKAPVKSFRK